MGKINFDDLLSKKFRDEDLPYNPDHWDKLSQLLPESKKEEKGNKILMISLGVAAAVALLLASVLLIRFINTDNSGEQELLHHIAKNEADPSLNGELTDKIAKPHERDVSEAASLHSSPTISILDGRADTDEPADLASLNTSPSTAPVGSSRSIQEVVSPQAKEETAFLPEREADEKSISPRRPGNPAYFPDYTQKTKQTSIAFSGGVNYGSLNTGYTIGFSAKQELGNNFFIDGTVAVMYNNNASDIGNYSGGAAGRPPGTAGRMAAPAFTPTENLYYMQFNPSFGYQIVEDIAVSVGGDMQQMISPDNNVEKVQLTQDGIKVFPILDIGLTGKAEFSVTPNIRAGVLLREGVNNVIKPKTTDYVNRRYFQVQFKYDIPVK